jgi:hypothetical protein
MLKNPASMKEILRRQNSLAISLPSFSCFATRCFAGNYRRALVEKSEMVRKSDGDVQ